VEHVMLLLAQQNTGQMTMMLIQLWDLYVPYVLLSNQGVKNVIQLMVKLVLYVQLVLVMDFCMKQDKQELLA
jgi:hypothetical protein